MLAVIALSLLFVVGAAAAAVPTTVSRSFGPERVRVRRLTGQLIGGVVAGATALAVSGWPASGVVAGCAAFWAIGERRRGARSADIEIERLDALATWIESVRDVLMAGEQLVGAINATVGACPPSIRADVRRLAAGLGRQEPELVFRRFADDLDDPLADLVAAGLAIAIRRGARTVPVLSALAEQARQQVERRRLVEAERAPTRREVRALTLIMSALVVGLMVFGRSQYLDAYDQPAGQVFLGVSLTAYAALVVRAQRLATFPRHGRFLTAAAHRIPRGVAP
jgi:hypothetical protein